MTTVRDDELQEAVKATNALTAAWCDVAPPGEFVLSGAGAWPLLALLEAGASGQALKELRTATGVAPAGAATLAVELMTHLGTIGVEATLALWIRAGVPINASWATELPASTLRELPRGEDTARAAMNQWASQATNGRIAEVEVTIHELTAVVLASTLRTSFEWRQAFSLGVVRWLDQEVAGLRNWFASVYDFGVIDGSNPVARFVSRGRSNIDVHVLSGAPDRSPAAVLRTGIAAVDSPGRYTSAASIAKERDVGGLRLVFRETTHRWGTIEIPAFTIRSRHNLLQAAAVFGLKTAVSLGDHFPGISPELSIDSASQQAFASFQAAGFEASAVTVISGVPGRAKAPRLNVFCAPTWCSTDPLDSSSCISPRTSSSSLGWVTTPVPPEAPEVTEELFFGRCAGATSAVTNVDAPTVAAVRS